MREQSNQSIFACYHRKDCAGAVGFISLAGQIEFDAILCFSVLVLDFPGTGKF